MDPNLTPQTPHPVIPTPIVVPQPVSPLQSNSNHTSSSKFPGFLIVFLVLIILGLVGYIGYLKMVGNKVVPSPSPITYATIQPTLAPTATPDPTADWTTYTNAKYKYSLKYPNTFLRLICPNEDLTLNNREKDVRPGPIEMNSCARGGRYTLETKTYETIQKEPIETKYYTIEKKNITIGGLSGKQYIYTFTNIETGPFPTWYTTAWVNKDGKTYEIYFDQKDSLSVFAKILSTFKFVQNLPSPSSSPQPTPPTGWKANTFTAQKLTIYTPIDWQSGAQDFATTSSTLIKFWKKVSPEIVPIQLDIKPNWDNTGNAKSQTKNYKVAGIIDAYRVDPPKKIEATLERYQTNVYFEYLSKVYVFECVHNWVSDYVDTCNKMLETLSFTY